MKGKRIYRHPAMRILRRAIRREQLLQLSVYALILLGGGYLVWRSFSANTLLVIIGLFFSMIGFFYTIRLLKSWQFHHHPIIDLLQNRPGQVVWVYTVSTQSSPYGITLFEYGYLYFKLVDGDEYCVRLPARHLRLISHYLGRLLPHATFGYSKDKEQLYRINPEMLMK